MITFQQTETPSEQGIFIATLGSIAFYCLVVFNRTAWDRQQRVENWDSSCAIYYNGVCIERSNIPMPEPFENVTEYCLEQASEICENWLNIHATEYIVTI